MTMNQDPNQLPGPARAIPRGWLRGAGMAGLVLLAAAVLFLWRGAAREAAVERPQSNRIGPATALAHVVIYSDFGCPACRDWHQRGIREQLLAQYGEQISFEFRHYPVITRQSPLAAEAGLCAAAQEAFWPYHDYLFVEAPPGALSEDDLRGYATAVGLDEAAFSTCLTSGQYREAVRQDMRAAQTAGARGTPTLTVNGRQVFPTYNGLAEAIDAALGK